MKANVCIFFTSFQQAVGVSILQQVAVDGDVVQGLEGRALLHVFVGHRETGLGAVTHQTTTGRKKKNEDVKRNVKFGIQTSELLLLSGMIC